MENIFEKGCLVQLSISMWGARRKIDHTKLAQMTSNHEWLHATKKLVDPESLKPVAKLAGSARLYLNTVSLPFPIHGMVFVPKDLISRVDEKLQEFQADFEYNVNDFVSRYPGLRDSAIAYLGDLFNQLDYPVDVRGRFKFVWRFVALDVPNGRFGLLAPEVYEREKQKFIQTMEEARELAVQSLRQEFAGLVEHVCERFTLGPNGEPKKFKNATVHSFYDFFQTFKERNVFEDEGLSELVDRAKAVLNGTSADTIRESSYLKDRINAGMHDVYEKVEDMLNVPRRKIVMD